MSKKTKNPPKEAKGEKVIDQLHAMITNGKPTVRMDFYSYTYLKNLLDDQLKKLEREFQTACNYIPSQTAVEIRKGYPNALDKAHKIFSENHAQVTKIKNELHAVAAASYKDHPNPEMRAFWGLD